MRELRISEMNRATRVVRALFWMVGIMAGLFVTGIIVFQTTPAPWAMLVKRDADKSAQRLNDALASRVPPGISAIVNQCYDPNDPDAILDVYVPSVVNAGAGALPTIVWIHGGGYVGGSKDFVANYCRILSAKEFTVVAVGYSLAPGKTYPTPVTQVNAALAYLRANPARLHVDTTRLILAGDAEGAQIAAQLANVITVPRYADAMEIVPALRRKQLDAVVLMGGVFDFVRADYAGRRGGFLKTVLWAYSGEKDFAVDQNFASASVVTYVTKDFPRTFIAVGDADPLAQQSHWMAETLARDSVAVETVFFDSTAMHDVPANVQFMLDSQAGAEVFRRLTEFLGGKRGGQHAKE